MQDLINETMDSYNHYIKKVIEGSLQIADKLREEELKEALALISDFSEGTIWLINVNRKMDELGYSVKLDIESIQTFLMEVNEGLQKQDYVIVADMFEYEILPFFEQLELYKI